jgi:uroporphyrinogen decarboxylase
MTPKDMLLTTLQFREPEAVPHFEDTFELPKEAFGLDYPSEKEWAGASGREKRRLLDRLVEIYARTVTTYDWAAIYVWRPMMPAQAAEVVPELKRAVGSRALVGGFIWAAAFSLECITDYVEFSVKLFEHPEALKAEAEKKVQESIESGRAYARAGADFVSLPNDWAHNGGLFMSRPHFEEFVMPYFRRIVAELKKLGLIVVVHSDGNIMDILDLITDSGVAMLQSIDPLAGMDIVEVKKRTYGKIALQGNVKCTLLQGGTPDEVRQASLHCLKNGSPGGGYVFGTSNCIFDGASLGLYGTMLETLKDFNASGPRKKDRELVRHEAQ